MEIGQFTTFVLLDLIHMIMIETFNSNKTIIVYTSHRIGWPITMLHGLNKFDTAQTNSLIEFNSS